MTEIQKRKCANCASWRSVYGVPQCCNGVFSLGAPGSDDCKAPTPDDYCPDHLTVAEDMAESEMAEAYRRMAGDWAALHYVKSCTAARWAMRKAEGLA